MVLRLFVPPGEGQHQLVPRRPDPIGANATLQYSVIISTTLAGAYTSFASQYHQRVTLSQTVSKTALFIRSSATLGICAGVAGAAVNWYYHTAFTNVVLPRGTPKEVKKWKLYEWTKSYTVEDGALEGVKLGLAASIPMLFMRRPDIARWTRCLGMANIGACIGILAAHGYLQYTGERQKAYSCLGRRLKRRSLEFWHIHRDKELMAKLDPVMQHYVRHNGVWYTQLPPEEAFEQPDKYVRRNVQSEKKIIKAEAPVGEQPKQSSFYPPLKDYAIELRELDEGKTLATIAKFEADNKVCLKEAEYLLFVNAQQQYDYCHAHFMDDDERQRRLREIDLVARAYDHFRNSAQYFDVKLIRLRLALQQNAAWMSSADLVAGWLLKSDLTDVSAHNPKFSIQELEHMHETTEAEVKKFEECASYAGLTPAERDKCRKDAEDGRVALRAAEHIISRFEKAQKALEESATAVTAETKSQQKSEEDASVEVLVDGEQQVKSQVREEYSGKSQAEEKKPAKPDTDDLDSEEIAPDEAKLEKSEMEEEQPATPDADGLDLGKAVPDDEKHAKPDGGDLDPEKAAPDEEKQETNQVLVPQPPAKASSSPRG